MAGWTRVAAALTVVSTGALGTHVALERSDGPPAPETLATADSVAPPSLYAGGVKVDGDIELLADLTISATDVGDRFTLHPAGRSGTAQVVFENVVVDGERVDVVWSGAAPLAVEGSVTLRSERWSTGGEGGLELDADRDLRAETGDVSLTGPVEVRKPKEKSPGPETRDPRPGVRTTLPEAVLAVDGASRISGVGRVVARSPGPLELVARAPISLGGDLTVSGPRTGDRRLDRLDVVTGTVTLVVGAGSVVSTIEPIDGQVTFADS